jgi:hypothetical protein
MIGVWPTITKVDVLITQVNQTTTNFGRMLEILAFPCESCGLDYAINSAALHVLQLQVNELSSSVLSTNRRQLPALCLSVEIGLLVLLCSAEMHVQRKAGENSSSGMAMQLFCFELPAYASRKAIKIKACGVHRGGWLCCLLCESFTYRRA